MKQLDHINGYVLAAPFHTGQAGNSEWTFARRDGRDYFIKR